MLNKDGMTTVRKKRKFLDKKSVPASLYPPSTPDGLPWGRTSVSAVRGSPPSVCGPRAASLPHLTAQTALHQMLKLTKA